METGLHLSHQSLWIHARAGHRADGIALSRRPLVLLYRADDLDGAIRHEWIHQDTFATIPEFLSVEKLERLIREATREPMERNTRQLNIERDVTGRSIGTVGKDVAMVLCDAAVASSE